ncbi:hypothetical protein RRG08_044536 [Elysia crispata]|uniref:Uncharacterized protein n=1 Tax=Elysia crispata TaxID=231223 RepID=A0AAE1DDX9_9GAST|nr:hypothetical protein RRG08_044536 [Elysia crispata]
MVLYGVWAVVQYGTWLNVVVEYGAWLRVAEAVTRTRHANLEDHYTFTGALGKPRLTLQVISYTPGTEC